MEKTISIRMKYFSGIDKELKLQNYNPAEGVIMTIPRGKRLRYVLKTSGISTTSPFFYFREGQRITSWAKLREGDEITCLKPSGGG